MGNSAGVMGNFSDTGGERTAADPTCAVEKKYTLSERDGERDSPVQALGASRREEEERSEILNQCSIALPLVKSLSQSGDLAVRSAKTVRKTGG